MMRGYCMRSKVLTELLYVCNFYRLDRNEKSVCLLIFFASYHQRYNRNTQKEMALERSKMQSSHLLKALGAEAKQGDAQQKHLNRVDTLGCL